MISDTTVLRTFKRRFVVQVLASIILCAALLPELVYKDHRFFMGFSRGEFFEFGFIALTAYAALTAVNWRCPACNKFIGNNPYPVLCRWCNVPFQPLRKDVRVDASVYQKHGLPLRFYLRKGSVEYVWTFFVGFTAVFAVLACKSDDLGLTILCIFFGLLCLGLAIPLFLMQYRNFRKPKVALSKAGIYVSALCKETIPWDHAANLLAGEDKYGHPHLKLTVIEPSRYVRKHLLVNAGSPHASLFPLEVGFALLEPSFESALEYLRGMGLVVGHEKVLTENP
jgi:hypothetical protein